MTRRPIPWRLVAFRPADFARMRAAGPHLWCPKCGPVGRWHEHFDPDRSKGETPPVAMPCIAVAARS